MRLLLDTHALVWWWTDDRRLPAAARSAIADPRNLIYASTVSAWEIATKHRIGKWPEVGQIVAEYPSLVRRSRFVPLPVAQEHALLGGSLDIAHRDPFDRMLIAQALTEDVAVVSGDAVFQAHCGSVVWLSGAEAPPP